MTFVQIIDFETDRIDEMKALADEMGSRLAGRENSPTRRLILKDRSRPGHYLGVIEFNSYEEAMQNSNDPETSKFAEQMAALCIRPPSFTDCDVVDLTDFT
ncbi:hypothetical protein [Streptomyces hyaluromycini]|uniref:hypothetical protein n=1 Tax=Streptomyces hyaluromycini TaxID=1377993 RepID=UPI001237E7F2|nr:hypothetical protein [Streptomyces hyaluromycini]